MFSVPDFAEVCLPKIWSLFRPLAPGLGANAMLESTKENYNFGKYSAWSQVWHTSAPRGLETCVFVCREMYTSAYICSCIPPIKDKRTCKFDYFTGISKRHYFDLVANRQQQSGDNDRCLRNLTSLLTLFSTVFSFIIFLSWEWDHTNEQSCEKNRKFDPVLTHFSQWIICYMAQGQFQG